METKPTAKRIPCMLIFREAGPEVFQHLSTDERLELTRKWNDWYDGLAAQGKVQHGQPLGLEGRVVSGARGERVVDGPYAEAKEAIAGYFLLSVSDLDEATAIAKMCPNLSLGMSVEVRPIAEVSPVLEGVRGRPPKS